MDFMLKTIGPATNLTSCSVIVTVPSIRSRNLRQKPRAPPRDTLIVNERQRAVRQSPSAVLLGRRVDVTALRAVGIYIIFNANPSFSIQIHHF